MQNVYSSCIQHYNIGRDNAHPYINTTVFSEYIQVYICRHETFKLGVQA